MRQLSLLTLPARRFAGPFRAGFEGAFLVKLIHQDNSIPSSGFFDPFLSVACVSLDVPTSSFCETGPSISLVGPGEYLVGFRVGVIW